MASRDVIAMLPPQTLTSSFDAATPALAQPLPDPYGGNMKRIVLAAIFAASVAHGAPVAQARCHTLEPWNPQCWTHAQHVGGCSFAAVTDVVAGQGQMTGEIDVEAIVYSENPADNPVSATFTCYIKVNGSPQAGASVTASGTVAVVGGGVVTYTSNSVADDVQLCEDVSYSNGVTTSECFEATTFEIPPPIVWEIVDPAVCPVLAALAGTYGPVVIEPGDPTNPNDIGGDVYIDGELFFDCPTYEAP